MPTNKEADHETRAAYLETRSENSLESMMPHTCLCCRRVQSFASCLCRGRDAEISAGVMAASVPSAGMVLHQTDFAFLPV